jgi:hypothetical protein
MADQLKGKATYWGGHLLHPINERGEDGIIQLTENKLIFNKLGGLFNKGWNFEIFIDKIIWNEVSQETGQDIKFQQKMGAYAYLAGYGPMSSFNRQITYFIIPYIDENSVKHQPKFTIGDKKVREEVSKIIYEHLSSK